MASRAGPGLALKTCGSGCSGARLTLEGEDCFFPTKKEARADAKRLGMNIRRTRK